MKFQRKLPGDTTTELMLLINFLWTQLQAAGFHPGLLPDVVAEVHPRVVFPRSPVNATMIMSCCDCPEWSNQQQWAEQHRKLGFSLHRVIAVIAKDSAAAAPLFCHAVSEQSTTGDGFAALNNLLQLHFPHVNGAQAPSFDAASAGKILQGPDEAICL